MLELHHSHPSRQTQEGNFHSPVPTLPQRSSLHEIRAEWEWDSCSYIERAVWCSGILETQRPAILFMVEVSFLAPFLRAKFRNTYKIKVKRICSTKRGAPYTFIFGSPSLHLIMLTHSFLLFSYKNFTPHHRCGAEPNSFINKFSLHFMCEMKTDSI